MGKKLKSPKAAIDGGRRQDALKQYSEGSVSFGRAVELSGLNVWEFADLLEQCKIPLNLSAEEFLAQSGSLKLGPKEARAEFRKLSKEIEAHFKKNKITPEDVARAFAFGRRFAKKNGITEDMLGK